MVRFRRHHNNNGRRTVRSGRTAKQVKAMEKKILKRGGDMPQEKKSTTIPSDIMAMQRKNVAARSPGTEKLLADTMKIPADKALIEILKNSLADVTSALKSNANALHKDRHHPLPFAMCQSDECVCNGNIINGAIAIVTKTNRLDEIDEELKELDESQYEPDPDQLAHDPDLPPPSKVKP